MQLTRFTDYALRTLTFLAIQPGDRLSTITEVADTFAISRNHVVKIVHQLGIKGYIETVRGKHGGIRLGRSAVSINLRDVVMDMEHVLCPVDCIPVSPAHVESREQLMTRYQQLTGQAPATGAE